MTYETDEETEMTTPIPGLDPPADVTHCRLKRRRPHSRKWESVSVARENGIEDVELEITDLCLELLEDENVEAEYKVLWLERSKDSNSPTARGWSRTIKYTPPTGGETDETEPLRAGGGVTPPLRGHRGPQVGETSTPHPIGNLHGARHGLGGAASTLSEVLNLFTAFQALMSPMVERQRTDAEALLVRERAFHDQRMQLMREEAQAARERDRQFVGELMKAQRQASQEVIELLRAQVEDERERERDEQGLVGVARDALDAAPELIGQLTQKGGNGAGGAVG